MSISGEVDWAQRTNRIAAGVQTVRWRYSKDGSVNSGQDRAWVDQISFTPDAGSPPIIVAQPQGQFVPVGSNVTLSVSVTGTPPFGFRWQRNGATILPQGAATMTIANAQLADSGNYTVVVTNLAQPAGILSSNAVVMVFTPPRLQSPRLAPNGDFQFNLLGDAGRNYDLEGTTNLSTWTRLTTISNVTGSVAVTTTNAPLERARFYRARLLSP